MDPSRNAPDEREYLTLNQAAKLIPGRCGDRISLKSLHRWCRKGLRNGALLRSERVGGSRCTTRPWLEEFFEALTRDSEPEGHPRPVPRTSSGRRASWERAVEELEAAWARKRS